MEARTITIALEEYKDLLKKAERIATLERMQTSVYIPDDIKNVLDISEKKE